MTMIRVTIIGMGPRGLSILQRIGELAPELPGEVTLEVHLVDPGDTGQGTHSARQSPHLLTNTVASQVTMFIDDHGPSFTEWAHAAGYRKFGGAHHPTGGGGEAVGEGDYLPRSMLGEYLSWVADRTIRLLPPHIRVVHHRRRALDVETAGPAQLAVHLEDGFAVRSDFVFLTTGHCERIPTEEDRQFDEFVRDCVPRNDHLVYCANPYPVEKLHAIAPGATVAVQGLGLTAHDVIAALTVGRGGRFEGAGNGMRYLPSGREPVIHLFSRNCLPSSARGVNQKGVTGGHRAKFLTEEAVRQLREASGGQLDFERDVLPLLLREMGHTYRTVLEQRRIPPESYEFGPEDADVLDLIFRPLRDKTFANLNEFKKFFVEYLEADLEQAELGNLTSPVKAATDVIRDTRQILRDVIDFAGLTPGSHRKFLTEFDPLMNRVAFGPPRRRNFELLALLDAGVVDVGGGSGCRVVADRRAARFALESEFTDGHETRHVDALVVARLDSFHPETDRSPLYANLLARGLARPFMNGPFRPGGVDVDRNGRLITAAGTPLPHVWALGYPAEGPRYHTHHLPRPGLASQFLRDADGCIRDLFTQIQGKTVTEGGDHANSKGQPVSVS